MIQKDKWNRDVQITTNGSEDIYQVLDAQGVELFKVQVKLGTPSDCVFETINAMAPSDQVGQE